MSWHQLSVNPQSLDSLYEKVPELVNVELFSVEIDRLYSNIRLRVDLASFPNNPPTRWHNDFNTVQVHLSFSPVKKFEAKGWHKDMKVSIDIQRNNEDLEVVIANPKLDLIYTFTCEFLRIENISPYING